MLSVNLKNSIAVVTAVLLVSACQNSKYQVSEGPNGAGDGTTTDLGNGCYLSSFVQPKQEISRKIDLIFVADTSRSVFKERASAADGIDAFMASLPKDADVRAGVVLAHGNTSPYAGRLYVSKAKEPAVLNSAEHSAEQMRAGLRAKLTPPTGDKDADGGELGMYSLQSTLKTDNFRKIREQGLYRSDASLAVVFLADENDICAVYPKGVQPQPDPQGMEPIVRRRNCKGVTAEGVYGQLRKMKGEQPITVAGILYTPESKIVRDESSDEFSIENEIGYGYIDMIRLSNGVAIDLASGKIAEGLSAIGKLAATKLDLRLEFPIAKGLEVKPESVEVKIDGRPTNNYRFESATKQVHLTEGGAAGSKIEVKYCKQ